MKKKEFLLKNFSFTQDTFYWELMSNASTLKHNNVLLSQLLHKPSFILTKLYLIFH